jgi:thioredoxin-dependent peroxiredoxin
MADVIQEGDKAPAFSLLSDEAKKVKLNDFAGAPLMIFFYPADDTPACTKEACNFRDKAAEFAKLGAKVIGISPDSADSHAKFKKKFKLNFPLLVDEDHAVADKYGVWGEKNLYGKKFMGLIRSTFLIDAKGKIAKAWRNIRVAGHDERVIAALRELVTASAAK